MTRRNPRLDAWRRPVNGALLAIAVVLGASRAAAAESVDTAGFAVAFPDGWRLDPSHTQDRPRHIGDGASPIQYHEGEVTATQGNSSFRLSYMSTISWDAPRAKYDFNLRVENTINAARSAAGLGSSGAPASTRLRFGDGLTGMESYTPKASTPPSCAVLDVYVTEHVVMTYSVDQFASCAEAIETARAIRTAIQWKLDKVALNADGSVTPLVGDARMTAEVVFREDDQLSALRVTNYGDAPAVAIALRLQHYAVPDVGFQTKLRTIDSCARHVAPLAHGAFWNDSLGPPGMAIMRAVVPTPVAVLYADGTTWGEPVAVQALQAKHRDCESRQGQTVVPGQQKAPDSE